MPDAINQLILNHPKRLYTVLSASRMTDMVAFYPDHLISEVKSRIAKGIKIHTLVLWTKHPQKLFSKPLYDFLLDLKKKGVQLYIHLTITGMAREIVGTDRNRKPVILEPNVPHTCESLSTLPQVTELTGKPERIRLRIDPIVRLADANDKVYTNLDIFTSILKQCVAQRISYFTFSFLEKGMHRKVDARFKNLGFTILPPDAVEREKMLVWTNQLAAQYHIAISACCVPGLPTSSCIDGFLLEKLHAQQLPLDHRQPKSRPLCRCSQSIDLGGWPPKKCLSGCLYCYSNPAFVNK